MNPYLIAILVNVATLVGRDVFAYRETYARWLTSSGERGPEPRFSLKLAAASAFLGVVSGIGVAGGIGQFGQSNP